MTSGLTTRAASSPELEKDAFDDGVLLPDGEDGPET